MTSQHIMDESGVAVGATVSADTKYPHIPAKTQAILSMLLEAAGLKDRELYFGAFEASFAAARERGDSWLKSHQAAQEQISELQRTAERLECAIRWANGEGDSDFGDNVPPGAPRYWWRKVLMTKAGLRANG